MDADPDQYPFAWLIARERRRQSLSQDELAKRVRKLARDDHAACGTSRQTINRYERGKIIPNPDTLRWLATALCLPIAQVVAAAASQRSTGRRDVAVDSQMFEAEVLLPADAGMDAPSSPAVTLTILQDWLRNGLMDRRTFLAVSGTALTSVARQFLPPDPEWEAGRLPEDPVHDSLADQVDSGIRLIRTMDDAQGGASHLSYVGAYFQSVAVLLREGSHPETTTRRLLGALAELAQQAGWMAYDAAHYGLAQRYYLTGLRIAHEARDWSMAAHILADLSHQAAWRGEASDGMAIGKAALHAARHSPASVGASIMTRLAYANATAGHLHQFDRTLFQARELLEKRRSEDDPGWMYYMTPSHIDAQAGVSLIHQGWNQVRAGEVTRGRKLLAAGEDLLRKEGTHAHPPDHPHQRRSLFEGAWLALACSAQGNLAGACETGRLSLLRLNNVRSPRSVVVLRALSGELRRRSRERHVRDFLPELDLALRGQVSPA